uniref:Putative conserved secreted protein n=1 Tax=Phlebotomus kandelakii TaxID=1109342 RepID=A0A6B2E6C3_9DIPT
MDKKRMNSSILLFLLAGFAAAVEVHFETPDSGFFLKHSPRQPASDITSSHQSGVRIKSNQESILSVDRFTVVQTTQPVSIRASYGPFSTKQTVPARYIVPDVVEAQPEHMQNATAALMDLQQSNIHLDISAHLVRTSIPRDSPVLRVLFHAGADPGGHVQRQKICVLLHVAMGSRMPLKGRCMPEGEDGVCVAEVVVPSSWWPPLPPPDKDGRGSIPPKVPQRLVQVSYSVFEPPTRNPEQCEPKVQIQPLTPFAQVPLVPAMAAYKELRADETLTMLVPHQPLYPMSKIHVPVFLQSQPDQNVAVFIVRARVKAGMRILGATASSDEWNISLEKENPKHTVARVTAFRKDQDPDSNGKNGDSSNSNKIVEVFSWLLEVANDTKEHWDGGRIVWSVSYVHDGPKLRDSSVENMGSVPGEELRRKLVAKLEIQKDDIQAVLPISKNWEVMNTAVLTGRQVSQAMKVFIVSQAGKVADVTLQSSCHAEDESVIKVSSSCSSVYVDGSEARGSSNASIIVKYGTYIGRARFTVWMPEFPLEVLVADFRLSQIKGWKVPEDYNSSGGKMRRKKRAYGWNHHGEDFVNGVNSEKATCRARYQQSPVEVYARFLAVDQDSGRVSYLISRRTGLRVTDLVQPLLRVADPKIATLRGRTLQGRAMGRTDVQVLSPITGRVIGAKEVRVGSDKVTLSRLIVRVVSGLQLTIAPDSTIDNGYIAETSVTRRLTAQYQEGLLDIDLEFSDGARTPLRDVSVDDYFLLVESLDTEVVAFAPMLASHHPRVIAVGEGSGDLLRVTLLLSEECRLRKNVPLSKQNAKVNPGHLATALATVQVDFSSTDSPGRPDTVQNDGFSGRERKGGRDMGDLNDILIGIPLKDDNSHEPTVQARQHRGGVVTAVGAPEISHKSRPHADMTSLEIGMYVLLTAFCFAIAIFVVSCVVYASKFRPVTIEAVGESDHSNMKALSSIGIIREPRHPREPTTNAHDWVWLGRSTLDKSTAEQEANRASIHETQMRITSNPMNLNYVDPDDAIVQATSFDNPNHIQLPSMTTAGPSIDTKTYNKRERRCKPTLNFSDGNPPPLPPHGIPGGEGNRENYRPPVPPHRNIGVTANANYMNGISHRPIPESIMPPQRRHHHKHHRSASGVSRMQAGSSSSASESPYPIMEEAQVHGQHNLNYTQQQINAALFNMDSPPPLPPLHHVEEIFLEQSRYVKSPGQTPTGEDLPMKATGEIGKSSGDVTQERNTTDAHSTEKSADAMLDSGIGLVEVQQTGPVQRQSAMESPQRSTESESDDNGGFVTPPGECPSMRAQQVKRATVVGNPMFSNSEDSDLGPSESLGLDDLDMDYEQIMHYFDNLKESNA